MKCFEIVGPPGAGKTTLALELGNRNHHFHLIHPPNLGQFRNLPFLIKSSLSLIPVFAALIFGKQGRWLKLKEFFWMVLLNEWHRQLTCLRAGDGIIILDQGPVYWLAGMVVLREGQIRRPRFSKWWRKISERWGRIVDGVVWLDASDRVLADRIKNRVQNHAVKAAPFSEVRGFLERSRGALRRGVAMLRSGRPASSVFVFDTGQLSLDEIADRLLEQFDWPNGLE